MLTAIEKALAKLENAIIILVVLGIVASIFLQVIFRYVIQAPLSWTEELARSLLIWLTFVGAALALREGGHFALDVLIGKLPAKIRAGFELVLMAITAIFLSVLLYKGLFILPVVHQQTSASLRIPMSFVYLAIPVGSGFMLFHTLALSYRKAFHIYTGVEEEEPR